MNNNKAAPPVNSINPHIRSGNWNKYPHAMAEELALGRTDTRPPELINQSKAKLRVATDNNPMRTDTAVNIFKVIILI